ncbi:MAG: aminodeoxychorismate synthase component I [Candidatus Hydrogenedentota bacterium]
MAPIAPDTTTRGLCSETIASQRNEGDVCLLSTTEQRFFTNPVEIHVVHRIEEVMPLLEALDTCVQSEGLYVAGYLSYEASRAFDDALRVVDSGSSPLCWFGVYEEVQSTLPESRTDEVSRLKWTPGVSREEFTETIARIRDYIGAGDTYQVNYTFPMTARFDGDPYAWFRAVSRAQRGQYSAYIHAGDHHVLSASPELFFSLDGDTLTTKPMKGTIARGLTVETDRKQAEQLQASTKDRAENIMIVDLLRNDMGRISETGSVQVEKLFEVARYDTLWQMTSTISSKTQASVPEIFRALFPSGSVTGAPKIRTSEIIRELEKGPRGAYCGAVGWWGPNRQAEFNVAIRTATFQPEQAELVYPVGAAITWDSSPEGEYQECLLKAELVTKARPEFELLESLLWDGEFFLLERHLFRLQQSADYFGFPFDEDRVKYTLKRTVQNRGEEKLKVRLLLSQDGQSTCRCEPIAPEPTLRVAFAREPVDSLDVYLYHKTTNRTAYDLAVQGCDANDVILWNQDGEVTESTRANVVAKIDGVWKTPPVSSGLLAGTYRAQLLNEGAIEECVLMREDLLRADEVKLVNSVRRWMAVDLLDPFDGDQE